MAKTLACTGVYYCEDESGETAEFCICCLHCSRAFGTPYRRCSQSTFYSFCFKAIGDAPHPKCAVMLPYSVIAYMEANVDAFL